MKPYLDYEKEGGVWIREFNDETDELEWHRDETDRLIEVIKGDGWMFQLDDELPYIINKSNTIFIPKETFHRLHTGRTNLIVKIREYSDD